MRPMTRARQIEQERMYQKEGKLPKAPSILGWTVRLVAPELADKTVELPNVSV